MSYSDFPLLNQGPTRYSHSEGMGVSQAPIHFTQVQTSFALTCGVYLFAAMLTFVFHFQAMEATAVGMTVIKKYMIHGYLELLMVI